MGANGSEPDGACVQSKQTQRVVDSDVSQRRPIVRHEVGRQRSRYVRIYSVWLRVKVKVKVEVEGASRGASLLCLFHLHPQPSPLSSFLYPKLPSLLTRLNPFFFLHLIGFLSSLTPPSLAHTPLLHLLLLALPI